MSNNNTNNLWPELNDSKWLSIPSLGLKWIGKWTHSNNGYSLIIYDGADHWGERRDATYVEEKAEEWAACLESGVKELADLVLSQLEEKSSELRLIPEESQNKITIELTAFLDQLPYNWLFYLSKLTTDIIEHHWTIPVATTLEFMSERINRLEEELERRNLQLEELLPSKLVCNKDKEALHSKCMETAVQNIVSKGIGKVFTSYLNCSPAITQLSEKGRADLANESENAKPSATLPHNRPRQKLRKLQKGAICEEINLSTQDEEEMERRAQIQHLTQGSPTLIKKKKKLKI